MRLKLTSAGITNGGIHGAFVDLLGKPVAESKAVCVPTAIYALPGGNGYAWQVLRELGEMGWQEFVVLELTALPSILEENWLPAVEAADAIIVGGGNGGYLSYWMQESGLARKLPELLEDKVYVSISAGSAMATPGLNYDRERLERTGVYYGGSVER
jgi:dipeptidase E